MTRYDQDDWMRDCWRKAQGLRPQRMGQKVTHWSWEEGYSDMRWYWYKGLYEVLFFISGTGRARLYTKVPRGYYFSETRLTGASTVHCRQRLQQYDVH